MIFINGRGINPLVTIAAIALIIFIGILLLPIIGGLFLVFLPDFRFTEFTGAGVTEIRSRGCKRKSKLK